MSTLTLAVSKGRILTETVPLLESIGLGLTEDPHTTRKLVIPTVRPDVRVVVIRAQDVPTFVEYGAADLGIAGKDVLLEHESDGLYEPLDLGIAKCRLMVAGRKDAPKMDAVARVATKYELTARRYFANLGIQADIIKLYGSMELAPLVGLADRIVDLVETGNTLTANGLVAMEHITDISARLVVNKASAKMHAVAVKTMIDDLAGAVRQAQLGAAR
ncbi:MAG: ATP phosphoribosyltransferase [Gammaproteobacteria bacterium]|nr:ATP phosphoribosyltransferase [Gammaproteobacteria bacterium]